jgi:peroxiredoxin
MAKDLGLTFPLLSDPDLHVIRAYGAEHVGHSIARPSVFVIDRAGVIRYEHVGAGMADQPPVDVILAEARKAL